MQMKKYLTIPNILSLFRILLVPAFILTYLGMDKGVSVTVWPVVILAVSGITDLFDGMIARRFNQVTDLGKILDPFADKLTQISVLICLVVRFHDSLALWVLLILFFVKEVVILIGGIVMIRGKRKLVPQAAWFGKAATFEFYAAMLLLLLFPNMPVVLIDGLVLITAALALFSLSMYAIRFWKQRSTSAQTRKQ